MKEFFKYVFATVVGIILSTIVLSFLFFVLVAGIVATVGTKSTVEVKTNSILYLNLDQSITERTPENSYQSLFSGGEEKSLGFYDLSKALQRAQGDDNIKAIYINVSAPNAGLATLLEVRNALNAFKKSKKPIIAYSETYNQAAYYLASTANKIYLNPEGNLDWKGFSAELTFFKGSLDKLGIEAQIVRVGNYKSAVEPFINTKMSDYNRQQVSAYVNGMYETFLSGIADSRKLQRDSLYQWANQYRIQFPKDALAHRMVDGLKYKDEILAELRKITGQGEKADINTITINDYIKNIPAESTYTAANKIAVVFANGDIVGGEGSDEQIGSERISRAIRKARLDDKIKAIVLRVNSGGGSALASDVIWREIELSKKTKPVIASFGDVAASGGYYIGCAADSIFVQPNTITGSIGVFGIIPNFQNLLTNKLGLTFDGVKTGQYADIMSTNRPMSPSERAIIQRSVNQVYDTFISKVAAGRKKTKAQIDSLGGGHVWIGTTAVQNGLADRLGSFSDAIKSAAKKAKVNDYVVVEYPDKINPLKALLEAAKENISTYFTQKELGENYLYYKQIKKTLQHSGIQTRMDYDIKIN